MTIIPKSIVLYLSLTFCSLCFAQNSMFDVKYYGHLYINSEIDGHPARMLFDTGSPYCVLDMIFVGKSGHEYNNLFPAMTGGTGNNRVRVMCIGNYEMNYTLAGKRYRSSLTPIMNLKPVTGDYADGIIGMSDLKNSHIAIDYKNRKMGIWNELDSADVEGFKVMACDFMEDGQRILIPITIKIDSVRTIKGNALMDLGAAGSITITSATAKKYNLDNISPKMYYYVKNGGIGGDASGYDFRADSVTIGSFKFSGVTMDYSENTGGALSDREYIAIIGNDVWERFFMIIDKSRQCIYLRPNEDFGKPFEAPTKGFSYTDRYETRGYWEVNSLHKNLNAEKAGLRIGDKIMAVNGVSVGNIDIEKQQTLFKGKEDFKLTVKRGKTVKTIAFKRSKPMI